jgi:hypothetical protein
VEWVKLSSTYYLDPDVMGWDDAAEVLFTRGLAYVGNAQTSGRIPPGAPRMLSRAADVAPVVAQLVASGQWVEQEDGGWLIARWDEYQEELEKLIGRRKADAERKRRQRDRDRQGPAQLEAVPSAEVEPAKRAPRRARLDEQTFAVDDGMRAWATRECPGVDVDRATQAFLDYHASKGTVMADWRRAWMTWLRRDRERSAARPATTTQRVADAEALRRTL